MEQVIPLRERKGDIAVLLFFWLNLLYITYVVDIEQLTIPDLTGAWQYPLWPPAWAVNMNHNYGFQFDPLLIARPMWWKMTIWIDALFFGPFYVAAIYAWTQGKNWIRNISMVYASVMMTNVTIIMGEELFGPHATPHPWIVAALNAPWLLFPVYILWRMWKSDMPFTRDV